MEISFEWAVRRESDICSRSHETAAQPAVLHAVASHRTPLGDLLHFAFTSAQLDWAFLWRYMRNYE